MVDPRHGAKHMKRPMKGIEDCRELGSPDQFPGNPEQGLVAVENAATSPSLAADEHHSPDSKGILTELCPDQLPGNPEQETVAVENTAASPSLAADEHHSPDSKGILTEFCLNQLLGSPGQGTVAVENAAANPSLAGRHLVRLDASSPAETGSRADMSAKRDSDSDRTLTERCLEWCFLIWFPMEHLGDPGAKTDIEWDRENRRLPWGSFFKDDAECLAEIAIEKAKEEASTKEARLPTNSESIPQMHAISLREQTLKWLCLELHDYQRHKKRRLSSPSLVYSRIRLYTFYSMVCELGRQPFRVITTVGRLLYGLRYNQLKDVFDEHLTPDPGQANKWWRDRRVETEKAFSSRFGWEWLGRNCMKKAPDHAAEHMRVVLKALEEDFLFSSAHEHGFRAAYNKVLESPEVIEKVKKKRSKLSEKAGMTDKEPYHRNHRRHHDIERMAEHLIVCPVCGGIPELLKMKQRGTRVPELTLYLPVNFLKAEDM
jgi:hypothetical protein